MMDKVDVVHAIEKWAMSHQEILLISRPYTPKFSSSSNISSGMSNWFLLHT